MLHPVLGIVTIQRLIACEALFIVLFRLEGLFISNGQWGWHKVLQFTTSLSMSPLEIRNSMKI